MSTIRQYICALALLFTATSADAQLVFPSLDALLNYTSQKSTVLKSGDIKFDQAQRAKLAAIVSIADVNGNVALNVTNNTRLPVSLFPAEVFGGTPGSFQEVQTGVQYTNNFSQSIDVKLVNASGWQNLKLAKINIDLTATDNKINRKSLYENIAITYYNLLALQEQLLSIYENRKAADTLHQIVKDRFDKGLARQQDANDALVNYINIQASADQIHYQIQQQYIALKLLCDIPESEVLSISQAVEYTEDVPTPNIAVNSINWMGSQYRELSAFTSYRQLKFSILPYLSAFASNSNQQFSTQFSLLDGDVDWIKSNYVGLKIGWTIPTANTITQISKAKYDYLLAKQDTEHQRLKMNLDAQQLAVDFEKAQAQMRANKQIRALQSETYAKNFENYKGGILGLDQLMNSYNAMVSSQFNFISSTISVMLAQSKIKINNEIQ